MYSVPVFRRKLSLSFRNPAFISEETGLRRLGDFSSATHKWHTQTSSFSCQSRAGPSVPLGLSSGRAVTAMSQPCEDGAFFPEGAR